MRSARRRRIGRWRLSIAFLAFASPLASSIPGEAASVAERKIANCVPRRSLLRAEQRYYRRFHVLPRLYDNWRAADCFPRKVDDAALAASEAPAG